MDLGISGRAALVLGGSKGLGLGCAQALAAAGVRVAVNGRDRAQCEAAARALGAGAVAAPGDISDAEARRDIVREARAALGPLSILVTNAGGPPPGPVEDHDDAAWLKALETNMLPALAFARALLPDMRETGHGRIINITSFTVREPYPNMGLATGVRAGLTGAMRSLSHEVAADGVTVNNLAPGLMDTGALERVYNAQAKARGTTPKDAKQAMAQSVPMQRLGRAEDFGPACAFLASVHAAYITGQNLTVDGGLSRPLL
ncbi:SDR family oxidoreductase [Roseovarius spongiae]|uniref:SDR family oxidoreductase n=1 Tax=Roseovarius spongiae TaxID=2320272 RepID=A0A3A8B6L3_9RHOB|nr:SDR family oxidoreductase [Roseovarius spongiae]RKF16815.1 SDR family oxidoreductase [Roseovarius spongiae]